MDITTTYQLQPEVEKSLESWVNKRTTSGFFLHGPPGVGKTTLVYRVMKKLGYRVVELNASHTRTGTAFRKSILPLLRHGGVSEWLTQGSPDKICVLLDEIDGFSSGERGGLQELLAFARAWKPAMNTRPLVLISNTVEGRPMEQLRRQCVSMKVRPPTHDLVKAWLKKDVPETWAQIGDLREIIRLDAGLMSSNISYFQEESEVSDILLHAWSRLYESWDPYEQIYLANHETNLAGLVLHENLPNRIRAGLGNGEKATELYERIFNKLMISDKADFVAFFYQCWPVLRISQKMKLVVPQQIINTELPEAADPPEPAKIKFTNVLAKQSALFNAWKEMCRAYDCGFESGATEESVPIRLSCVLSADPQHMGTRFGALAFPC
jgi:DNA polymerase III delta prime subunit